MTLTARVETKPIFVLSKVFIKLGITVMGKWVPRYRYLYILPSIISKIRFINFFYMKPLKITLDYS
jgi:hypothetical protein